MKDPNTPKQNFTEKLLKQFGKNRPISHISTHENTCA